jgi:S-DNA-T family DNA segregation ATPase FtsK/SpoIIIE
MLLRLTLTRAGKPDTDLLVEVEPGVTAGTLARALAGSSADLTVGIGGDTALRVLPADARVAESGLRSGAVVRVVPASAAGRGGSVVVALLRVLEGPDAGREFPLPAGATLVGRDAGCGVVLTDPEVSRQHARILVGEVVEIVDTNSVNGVVVGDGLVRRAVLRAGETARLGDSRVAVDVVDPAAAAGGRREAELAFNRSPRPTPPGAGIALTLPAAPTRPHPYRFPAMSLLLPVLVGVGVYALTRQPGWLWMLLLNPLLLACTYVEEHLSARKVLRQAIADFRTELAEIDTELAMARARELDARLAEHPAVGDVIDSARTLDPLLWTRRPDDAAFLELRLGTGTRESRQRVEAVDRPSIPQLRVEVAALLARHRTADGVPVVGSLRSARAIGVAGREDAAAGVMRGLVAQLVGLHSPAELIVTAVVSTGSARRWEWLKWLPHTGSSHTPLTSAHLACGPVSCLALVTELDELAAARASSGAAALPVVMLLVENDTPVDRSLLVGLAERGAAGGVHVLWVAPALSELPAACRAVVDVTGPWSQPGTGWTGGGPTGSALLGTGQPPVPVHLDWISLEHATAFAHRLAPVVDAGARVAAAADLPSSVSFLSLAGAELAGTPRVVIEEWTASGSLGDRPDGRRRRPRASLRAVVGEADGEAFHLDLIEQGPHALVGGTTGAGKSELLQTWILGMATRYSPRRVTFLLVDYKGGAAFGDCQRLPHCVGMVTDLNTHLVRRALISLNAELRHREHVLNGYRAKDLSDLERDGIADAPPRLVIVVDEFAALVSEIPEFIDGMVNVAQRGRSLGLHLILATQRPAGVIKENLRANTNLRVALRMIDEQDSRDVLDAPHAAAFDPSVPGRAMAKLGAGRLALFQTAYAGGWTSRTPPSPAVAIRELPFGPGEPWSRPDSTALVRTADPGPTDIRRIAATVTEAARELALAEPRKPWLPALADTYDLAGLGASTGSGRLVFGMRDLPERQCQNPVAFDADRHGNLAIFGAAGSGRTALLRTLAAAAGIAAGQDPCQVYAIDFGVRGLQPLEELPHVGAVVAGHDQERIDRLLRRLRTIIDERAKVWAEFGAGSLPDFRRLANAPDEPRVLLLVDGMSAFREGYELKAAETFPVFVSIATDGRQFGVHVVVTADRSSAVPSSLTAAMQHRLVLRTDEDQPLGDLGSTAVLPVESPPGRGLVDGQEFQAAILGGSPNTLDQAKAITALAAALRAGGVRPAPAVARLAEHIPLYRLPADREGAVVIGLGSATLEPVVLPDAGPFLVAGPAGSGRTTALRTIALALRRTRPDMHILFVGTRRTAALDPTLWSRIATRADELEAAQVAHSVPGPRALFVESLCDHAYGDLEPLLVELIRNYRQDGHPVVCEGDRTGPWSSDLGRQATSGRTGIALQPEQADENIFGADFPRIRSADFPPGRGLLVVRGAPATVQLAHPGDVPGTG